MLRARWFLLFVAVFSSYSSYAAPPQEEYDIAPQQFWAGSWATAPRLPAAGDMNGDHLADLVSLWPRDDGVIDLVATSPEGKPRSSAPLRRFFGRNGVAFVCGKFNAKTSGDALGVFADGSVRVFSNSRDSLAAQIPVARLPRPPIQAVAADFTGDQQSDVLLAGADSKAVLLQSNRNPSGPASFHPVALSFPLPAPRQWGAGNIGNDGRARLFWLAADGILYRSVLNLSTSVGKGIPSHAPPAFTPPVKVRGGFSPDAHLAVGRFRGEAFADVIVQQMLLPRGDPKRAILLPSLPTVEAARDDRMWLAADFDGNGHDDLLRTRLSVAHDFGEEALIHFSYNPGSEPAKGFYCSADDGLPDIWKLGLIHPGGLDLEALGCRVGRRDIVVELQPLADVSPESLKNLMDGVTRYFASIPLKNPDGSTGIGIHFLVREPIPTTERDSKKWADWSDLWRVLWPRYMKPEHRGITHYMGIQTGSAGYSEQERGWCGAGALEFIHELGHQLGLGHDGSWQVAQSAVYPSLMNYSYSYSRNGRSEDAAYSSGALTGMGALDERDLSEILPAPYDAVRYLSGPPYNFPLKPGDKPNTTFVDWNWNGIFGETHVRADINYSHGISMNPRFDVGYSWGAPALATVRDPKGKERLILFLAKFPGGTPVPPATAASPTPSVSSVLPGGLVARVWQGKTPDDDGANWSPEQAVQGSGVAGDCSAVTLGTEAYLAFPSASGLVTVRRVQMDEAGTVHVGKEVNVPDTRGAIPTLAVCKDRLALFLWRGPQKPITVRFLTPGENDKLESGSEETLRFTSLVPVGATYGSSDSDGTASLWVARMEPERKGELPGTEAIRLLVQPGTSTLVEADRQSIDGHYHRYRPTLLWEPYTGMSQGRVYLLSGGQKLTDLPWAEQYVTMQTAYPNITGGWQYRRYYTDDFASRCAPAACWFNGDMVYALRLYSPDTVRNDMVSLSFHGTGVTGETQGDYDDIGHLARRGLSHSIPVVN